MEKNYYDWLEVSKSASPEIIEKAYKTLVKKYHPDLQESSKKEHYEEIVKKINEAYEILSNPEKRKDYDLSLHKINNINNIKSEQLYEENKILKEQLSHLKEPLNTQSHNNNNINNNINNNTIDQINYIEKEKNYQKQINNAINKAYYDAYIQDLKNRGYKIKYKKTWKDYSKSLISLILTALILFVLWQIPFIQKTFINFYNNNNAFKLIVDIFKRTFDNLFH